MRKDLDWVGYDLFKISNIYRNLDRDLKLKDIVDPQEFVSKVIGLFRDVTEISFYVSKETHYALSNAGYNY